MNDEHIKQIARAAALEIIALVERIGREREEAARPLTVSQFAARINRCPEVVRRAIRTRRIPREHVSRRPPYLINPAALAGFGLTSSPSPRTSRV